MASFFARIIAYVLHHRRITCIADALFAAAFVVASAGLIARWIASGRFPVTNMYESLILYGWVLSFAYLVLLVLGGIPNRLRETIGIGIGLLAACFLAIAGSPLRSPELLPLVSILQSHWLALHVSFVFIGEGFFTVAFVAAVAQLLALRSGRDIEDISVQRLGVLTRRTIGIGFPFFTMGGLLFGMIWAKLAWGRYWGWDPKETFMLVTWIVYSTYLLVMNRRKWRGKRSAWIAVIGWMLALFTFVGVNFLTYGLHSYR